MKGEENEMNRWSLVFLIKFRIRYNWILTNAFASLNVTIKKEDRHSRVLGKSKYDEEYGFVASA